MKKFNLRIGTLLLSAIIFGGCGNSSYSDSTGTGTSEQSEETTNIDGTYSGKQNVSGLELVAELTIYGDQWSASSQLGYDSPEYQNGVIKGKDLYDDSGMIKIGYVSGSTASINGYPSMTKQ
jgi:hypothetical protein